MAKELLKGGVLILILGTGIVLQGLGVIDLSDAIAWIESHAHRIWAPVLLVGLMVVLYAFALPASPLMLAAGVMYVPWWATCWTVIGGVGGGLAAYYVVRHLSAKMTDRYTQSSLFRFMREHAGFSTLCALRVCPGFPHSVINYSAGLLRLSLPRFVISTAVGFLVKGFVYTSAVYQASHIDSEHDAFSIATVWPLAALSILLVAGVVVRKTLMPGNAGEGVK